MLIRALPSTISSAGGAASVAQRPPGSSSVGQRSLQEAGGSANARHVRSGIEVFEDSRVALLRAVGYLAPDYLNAPSGARTAAPCLCMILQHGGAAVSHAISYHARPYHTMAYPSIPYNAIDAVPHHAIAEGSD